VIVVVVVVVVVVIMCSTLTSHEYSTHQSRIA